MASKSVFIFKLPNLHLSVSDLRALVTAILQSMNITLTASKLPAAVAFESLLDHEAIPAFVRKLQNHELEDILTQRLLSADKMYASDLSGIADVLYNDEDPSEAKLNMGSTATGRLKFQTYVLSTFGERLVKCLEEVEKAEQAQEEKAALDRHKALAQILQANGWTVTPPNESSRPQER